MINIKSYVKHALHRILAFYRDQQRMQQWKSLKKTIDPKKMSYYPDALQKSLVEIVGEMEDFIRNERPQRLEQVIGNYFMMGLDRAGIDCTNFVLEPEYDRARNAKQPSLTHILSNKRVTSMYLQACGIRVSCAVGHVEDGVFIPVNNSYRTPFPEWLRCHASEEYFLKPSEGLQGLGCFRAVYNTTSEQYLVDGSPVSGQELAKISCGCVVEPRLIQHAQLREISPDAVFPIRIRTYIDNNGRPAFLSAYMAVGWKRSTFVNLANGNGIGFAIK